MADAVTVRPEATLTFGKVLNRNARVLLAGAAGGALCGLLIGGGGGRMAMFLLRLTSPDRSHFLETDDGFGIGAFTTDTVFLVLAMTFLGMAGGVLYVAVRLWIPVRGRPPTFALFGATVGGTLFIEPGGVDFSFLDPLWLAVALFVALPAVYGWVLALAVERLIPVTASMTTARAAGLAVPFALAFAFAAFVGVPVLVVTVAVSAWTARGLPPVWTTGPGPWIGRALLAGVMAISAIMLAGEVAEIL